MFHPHRDHCSTCNPQKKGCKHKSQDVEETNEASPKKTKMAPSTSTSSTHSVCLLDVEKATKQLSFDLPPEHDKVDLKFDSFELTIIRHS